MITARLEKYAKTVAKQLNTDVGETLLLIFLGAGVPVFVKQIGRHGDLRRRAAE